MAFALIATQIGRGGVRDTMAGKDAPVLAQLIRAEAIRRRWADEVDKLVVQAMDEGENQAEIARIIGRSREHLRTIRRRVRGD